MKNTSILTSLLFFLFFIIPVYGQGVKYIGTVEYSEEVYCTATGAGSDDTYRWNTSANKTRSKKGSIRLTFTKGLGSDKLGMALYGMESNVAEFQLSHNVRSEGFSEKVQQTCVDYEKKKSRVAKPGTSGRSSSTETRQIIGIPVTAASLQLNEGKYYLSITVDMKESVNITQNSEIKDPCRDKNPPPENDNFSGEYDAPVVIYAEGDIINPSVLAGQLIIEDITSSECDCPGLEVYHVHGDLDCSYNSKIIASWNLVKQCEALGSVGKELDKRDLPESSKNRIKDVLSKLDNPDIDPYVFLSWDLISTVKTESDADNVLKDKKSNLSDLREEFSDACEKLRDVKLLTDYIINSDQRIVNIINRFNQQMLMEHILTQGQVEIKDWIADQQRNSNSIYNSYAGK